MFSAEKSGPVESASADSNEDDYDTPIEKSIGWMGSIALITNNTLGPAMMGLPHLIQSAGVIPVLICMILVCVCSSISATLLSDSISSLPGNEDFSRPINFSTGFQYIVGKKYFSIVELLFIITCLVQACASIVETAQSLDQFIVTFILGNTYAIQLTPYPNILKWSPINCHSDSNDGDSDDPINESSLQDCSPFHGTGTMIISLGFICTTLLFLPFGRGNFKETLIMQFISYFSIFILCSQFFHEFIEQGFNYRDMVPWFGDDFSQLAGVILFNYAFIITVPSWLMEKKSEVCVNKCIWTSTISSTIMYIAFATLATMSFDEKGANILVLLASVKMSIFTRFCAVVFGVTIIGCGIPTFCIMIRNSLYHGGVCNKSLATFIGAYLPYGLSWMMYQGNILIHVLNWTGLIVNGLIAFILPLILVIKATDKISILAYNYIETLQQQQQKEKQQPLQYMDNDMESMSLLSHTNGNHHNGIHGHTDKPHDYQIQESTPLLYQSRFTHELHNIHDVDHVETEIWETITTCSVPISSAGVRIQNSPPSTHRSPLNSYVSDSLRTQQSAEHTKIIMRPIVAPRLSRANTGVDNESRTWYKWLYYDERLKYLYPRNTVNPLPPSFTHTTRKWISILVLCIFISIIMSNIVVDILYGISLDDEGEDPVRGAVVVMRYYKNTMLF